MLEFLLRSDAGTDSGADGNAAVAVRRSLILLNRPMSWNLIGCFWRTASVTVCADGAANRLFDLVSGYVRSLMKRAVENDGIHATRWYGAI